MITAILALAALSRGQRPTPSQLVSQMLAAYNGANTLVGTLTYVQSASDPSTNKTYEVHGKTTVQFERPNKLYIVQSTDLQSAAPGRIVSDGSHFLYCLPQDTRAATSTLGTANQANSELVESVAQYDDKSGQTVSLDLGQIYGVGSAGLPLHPCAPLDIAISRHEDLKAFVDQLATVNDQGDDTIDGKPVHLIGGDWRQYADAPSSGVYQLALTNNGDLVRYVITEKVADAGLDAAGRIVRSPVVQVTTTWSADLQINGKVDESLFKDKALRSGS